MKVALTDAGGGAGAWTVKTRCRASRAASTVAAPATRDRARATLEVGDDRLADAPASGHVTGFVILTHGADTRRIPFLVVVDHPVLADEHGHPARAAGRPRGHDARRAEPGRALPLPDRRRHELSRAPRSSTACKITKPRRELRRRVTLSGHAVPHVVYAGDENHLTGYAGLPDQR